MNKSNIFLVHTEYHLMIAINIITTMYSEFENHIYIQRRGRLNDIDDLGSSIHIHKMDDNIAYQEILLQMKDKMPNRFFIFQEYACLELFLSYNLSKLGAIICLVPDGLKPYVVWHKKHEFFSALKDTFTTYSFIYSQKAVIPKFVLVQNYKYGRCPFVNEVWLQYKAGYSNKYRKKIVEIREFTAKTLEIINRCFHYDFSNYVNSDIVVVEQPTKNIDDDIDIVKKIHDKFPHKQMVIKTHPLMSKEHIRRINELEFVEIIKVVFPVELLLLNLKRAIVISSHSASFFVKNPNCNYYWIHRLYSPTKVMSQLTVVNPTEHIVEVDSIDDIK